MTDTDKRNAVVESAKRIAIPILGFVLLLLVMRPLLSESGSAEDIDTGRERQRAYAKAKHADDEKAKLPAYDLDSLLAFDPFQPITVNASSTVAENETFGDQANGVAYDRNQSQEPTQPLAISALIRDSSGTAALLGSAIVREGDPWQKGYRVHRITPEGIYLIKTE